MMKRFFSVLLILCLLCGIVPTTALAVDESRAYNFNFSANGKQQITAATGDVITLTLVLERTDSSDSADMYSVQAEFWYDDTFFELVESSVLTYDNVVWTDAARRTGGRAFYLNFLSQGEGVPWESNVQMGTFQFRVIGQGGSSLIESKNCLVSTNDGMDTYTAVDNDVSVVVSTECVVTFNSMGGSEVPSQTVVYGEKIEKPEDPTRDGYAFAGWYTDLDRTNAWDFDNDTVKENMTLYALWSDGTAVGDDGNDTDLWPWLIGLLAALLLILLLIILLGKKTVTFDPRGGSPITSVKVKKGALVDSPESPVKAGADFVGWYTEAHGGVPWNFQQGKVKKNMTLYARWSESGME